MIEDAHILASRRDAVDRRSDQKVVAKADHLIYRAQEAFGRYSETSPLLYNRSTGSLRDRRMN